jgi:integrase
MLLKGLTHNSSMDTSQKIDKSSSINSIFTEELDFDMPMFKEYGLKVLKLTDSKRSEWTQKDYLEKFVRAVKFFGENRKIDSITVTDILEYKKHLAEEYGAKSSKSWQNHMIPLSFVFQVAEEEHHMMVRNPLNSIIVKQQSSKTDEENEKEKIILNDKQLNMLFDQFEKNANKARNFDQKAARIQASLICKLRALIGLRSSESIALKWEDFDEEFLTVRRQIRHKHGKTKILKPKMRKIRLVSLPKQAIEILESQRKKTGSLGEWVFLTKDGNHYTSAQAIDKMYKDALRDAQLPNARFYHLRASAATRMSDIGLSESVIIQQLGHTDIAVTRKHYQGRLKVDQLKLEEMAI